MRINEGNIQDLLEQFKKFGATPTGITRLAYSDEDLKAQEFAIRKFKELGLTVRRDAVGNIFARLQGQDAGLPTIATGSHLDTVKQAGAYDGTLGIVAILEMLRVFKEKNIQLKHSLEVIIFMAEESTRFGFSTIGSKLLAGMGCVDDFCRGNKENEANFKEVLLACGFSPKDSCSVKLDSEKYKAFLELHIEQGCVLAENNEQIGVVENIAAPTRMKITIEGVAGHSGATPMSYRKDALVSAAKLILAVEKIAKLHSDDALVATVGVADIYPGSVNVIPGKVVLWAEIRGVCEASIASALIQLQEAVRDIGQQDEIKIIMDMLAADKPVNLSAEIADIVQEVCQKRQIPYRRMNSGAGHDAMNMAQIMPTGMIFVPSHEGISHNPAEFTAIEDICVGVQVLCESIIKIDDR